MDKKTKLKKLDTLVLDTMIDILERKEDLDALRDLAAPINYLKSNAVVEEKQRDDITEEIRKRVEEAKKRRAKS
jgi:hypothetical protein